LKATGDHQDWGLSNDLIPNAILLAFAVILVGFMVFQDLRFTIRKRASKNWPAIEATIDSSSLGPQGLLHRVHFTYSYRVNGSNCTGRFDLLAGNTISVKELQQSVVGKKVAVRYDVRHLEISFLSDREIAGRRVMQGPIWTYR
jgi:Protein of unknown function (DUF3592)